MKRNKPFTEVSYFKGILFVTLEENHPEKPIDSQFIESRSELAEQTYEEAMREGKTAIEALETATAILLHGLHFSKTGIVEDILENEFSRDIESEQVAEFALKILPELEEVFAHYNIDDAFADSPAFGYLYTELTGAIQIYLENHGV